ncbi:hypothetical protein B0O99DRAFT_601779 [Bisporella sp. PMI_857]|nr:hypothetical protein B0O99DRAFT_601779 [Bisporella sp. PMI_857]
MEEYYSRYKLKEELYDFVSCPKEESKRFQKVVEDMPINVNGVIFPERFPKQTSLHLFPKEPNQGWVDILGSLSIPKPTKAIPLERERKPYTALPGEGKVHI